MISKFKKLQEDHQKNRPNKSFRVPVTSDLLTFRALALKHEARLAGRLLQPVDQALDSILGLRRKRA